MADWSRLLIELSALAMNNSSLNDSFNNITLNQKVVRDILNDHIADSYSIQESATIGLVVLYVPMFLVGLLGNGLLAILILTKRHLRNLTNLFLCNLAIADLAVTFICVPLAVGEALSRIWIYGEFMCKLSGFLQGVTVAASVFTITLLSVDRYLAIRHPIVFRRCSNNKVAVKLIVCVWLVSIGLMAPLLFVRQIHVLDIDPTTPVSFCGEQWDSESHRRHFDIALFVIVYIVPGVIICLSYGLIGTELWTENKSLNRTESETSKGLGKQMMQGRKRVAKMLIALAVLFAVCWLPYYIVTLYLDYHHDNTLLSLLPYTIFLGHSNSALNPILYFYSSKNFRRLLKRMLKCKKQRFQPTRRENLIVRCTRHPVTTTTALTRKPFIRILSKGSHSRSGSLRFSRSSNTSIKSTSASNRSDTSPWDKKMDAKKDCPVIAVIEPSFADKDDKHKKEFMACTISIPTTINEESSRRSFSVAPTRSRSQSMEIIAEQSNETEKQFDQVLEYSLPTHLMVPSTRHDKYN